MGLSTIACHWVALSVNLLGHGWALDQCPVSNVWKMIWMYCLNLFWIEYVLNRLELIGICWIRLSATLWLVIHFSRFLGTWLDIGSLPNAKDMENHANVLPEDVLIKFTEGSTLLWDHAILPGRVDLHFKTLTSDSWVRGWGCPSARGAAGLAASAAMR